MNKMINFNLHSNSLKSLYFSSNQYLVTINLMILSIHTILSHSNKCTFLHHFRSSIDHRCRGRPKGSKNRRKESLEKSS